MFDMEMIPFLIVLGLGVLICLSCDIYKVREGISALVKTTEALQETLQTISGHLEEMSRTSDNVLDIKNDVTSIEREISDIKYVTDVIYKYKLPSQSEQAFLDRVAIDEEVSNGISNARRTKREKTS